VIGLSPLWQSSCKQKARSREAIHRLVAVYSGGASPKNRWGDCKPNTRAHIVATASFVATDDASNRTFADGAKYVCLFFDAMR
jgi:hypothetical protein